jgi:hypothetical protein
MTFCSASPNSQARAPWLSLFLFCLPQTATGFIEFSEINRVYIQFTWVQSTTL